MQIVLTADTIIKAAAVLGALGALVGIGVKVVHWFDLQAEQDAKIAALEQKHDNDKKELRNELSAEFDKINKELSILVYGVQATLKGQQELGCNGPVTEAANTLERHINQRAHENGGFFHDQK
jgi:hypothetical protein